MHLTDTVARASALVTAVLAVASARAEADVRLPNARPAPSRVEAALPLSERLDAVLASAPLRRARISALVVRADDGSVLYEHSADRPLTPASNMKILTGMAALDAFGPTWRFETPVLSDRAPDAQGSVGVLYVRGSGDPVMNSEDWWRLAADLRLAGLRRVRGGLVLDDAAFDAARWHPDWGRTSSRAYHAPIGALMANYGAFAVAVWAGEKAGDPVRVAVDPPVPYLRVANRAVTGQPGQRSSVIVDRAPGSAGEIVHVEGVVPAGTEPKTYYRSVLDPTRYAGAVLRMQLEAVGIEIDGEVEVGPVPDGAHELLRFEGRPMAEIVRLFMKYSNNAVAEMLVKSMGAREGGIGSWEGGVRALRHRLEGLGVPMDGIAFVDGSGLSYHDKLTPRALVAALRIARGSFRVGPELTSALPIAAADGTLAERAEDAESRVRAKTGLLNHVTSLSGFASSPGGDEVVFSVLTNGYRTSDEEAMGALDRFAAELVKP